MGALIDRVGRSDTETPARLPDEQAVVERDGVRTHWESYGEGGTDGPAPAHVVGHPLAELEGADSLSRTALPGRHLRRARQRVLRPSRRAVGLSRAGVRRRRGRRARRGACRDRVCRGHVHGRPARAVARRGSSGARRRRVPDRADRTAAHSGAAASRGPWLRGRVRRLRGLGEVQPPLLAAGLLRLSRVLLLAGFPRAALDEADRGLRRLGPGHDARDARPDHARRRLGAAGRRRGRGALPEHHVSGRRRPWHARRGHPGGAGGARGRADRR